MNEEALCMFRDAAARFQEQTSSEFGRRLIADVLEPMEQELSVLTKEIVNVTYEIESLKSQLEED